MYLGSEAWSSVVLLSTLLSGVERKGIGWRKVPESDAGSVWKFHYCYFKCLCCCCCFKTVSLCSLTCPGPSFVDRADLRWGDLPSSASWVLGLKQYTTTAWFLIGIELCNISPPFSPSNPSQKTFYQPYLHFLYFHVNSPFSPLLIHTCVWINVYVPLSESSVLICVYGLRAEHSAFDNEWWGFSLEDPLCPSCHHYLPVILYLGMGPHKKCSLPH